MYGYNANRVTKPSKRVTKAKVLTVLNAVGRWTRVSYKGIDKYSKDFGVAYTKEIDEHRTEYYTADDKCVMVFEH